MRRMKKYLISFIVLFLVTLYVSRLTFNVYAQYGQYGGEAPSYSILIDKMVGKPSQNKGATEYEYFDNLSPSDPRFSPGQEVYFKIKVKNTSNRDITNVVVRDYVPSYLDPIEGPGSWDGNSRIITFNAGDFKIDEEKIYYIKMKVYDQANLPADRGLFCFVNKVTASSSSSYDEDTAQLCVEKQVIGAKTVPQAGPEMGVLILGLNVLTAGLGLTIRKLSDKN